MQIKIWNKKIKMICLLVYNSNLENLDLDLLEFFIILVSWPVYTTIAQIQSVFLREVPLSNRLLWSREKVSYPSDKLRVPSNL